VTEHAKKAVAEWVDGGVIADLLAESLKERGMRATAKNMKGLWLATLEDLSDAIEAVPGERIRREARQLRTAPKRGGTK
jgi:hypothetical protein